MPRSVPNQFDAYLTVDWSANNCPNTGVNSIWYCLLERADNGREARRLLRNPPTRAQAFQEVSRLLVELAARRRSTLVGFDFAYGYPTGFSRALKMNGAAPWRNVWNRLTNDIRDDESNRSNRFEVAGAINAAMSEGYWPFWGCPQGRVIPHLRATRSPAPLGQVLREFRLTDTRQRGPQSVWKLCYAGSVGSQVLMGIPYLARLRDHPDLAPVSRVWPFETGFELAARDSREWIILHAEIYPSLRALDVREGECKDAAQVRGLAEYFHREDEQGRLQTLFQPPDGVSGEELPVITAEEGWILGVR